MVPRDVAEFLVEQRNQLIQRSLIARLPAYEQFANRVRMLLIHSELRPQNGDVTIVSSVGPSQSLAGCVELRAAAHPDCLELPEIGDPIFLSLSAVVSKGQDTPTA